MKRFLKAPALVVGMAPCLLCSGGCTGGAPITVRDLDSNVLDVTLYNAQFPTDQLRITIRDATVTQAAENALELKGDSLQHVVNAAVEAAFRNSTQFNIVGADSDPDIIVVPSLVSAEVSSGIKGTNLLGDVFGDTESKVVVKALTIQVSLTLHSADESKKLAAGGAFATTNSIFSFWVKGVEDEGAGSEVVFESGSIIPLLQDTFKGAIMVANRQIDRNVGG